MLWQYILTTLSAVLFFGFVVLGVKKFGLLSCYSAYAPLWYSPKVRGLNWWQAVTIWSAFMLVPVLLTASMDSPFQFLAFLAPAFLTLVGASPDYATDKFQNTIHQIGAWGAAGLIVLYSFFVPHLLWVFIPFAVAALVASIVTGFKEHWMFWAEMAVYAGSYVIVYATIH